MPDAPPEPETIDVPPAPASARPMSNLERCIALRLTCPLSRVSCLSMLSHVSVVPCVFVLCVLPRLPDCDKKNWGERSDGLKW